MRWKAVLCSAHVSVLWIDIIPPGFPHFGVFLPQVGSLLHQPALSARDSQLLDASGLGRHELIQTCFQEIPFIFICQIGKCFFFFYKLQ